MLRRVALQVTFMGLLTGSAWAQSRVEVSGLIGYTLSEGVVIDPIAVPGAVYDSVDLASGFAFGLTVGVFVTENAEVEFMWTRQDSKLNVAGTSDLTLTGSNISTYHGNFVYNWGDEDAKLRPFLFGGLGATSYGFDAVGGFDVDGDTRFSTTWGGGVKAYPGRNVGVKLMGRWTPTYIKTDPGGVWCSPYWYWPGGCFVVGDVDYSNQFELTGGVTFRF